MSKFFKTWELSDVNSLGTPIEIHPTFNYDEKITSEHETYESETGRVRRSRLSGGALNFTIPLEYIGSGDANQIRTWWRSQTKIRFSTVFSDSTARFADCRIVNKTDPFGQYQKWELSRFEGTLNLISIIDYNSDRGISQDTREADYFTLGTSDGILAVNALA
jgi:hypothetical protein